MFNISALPLFILAVMFSFGFVNNSEAASRGGSKIPKDSKDWTFLVYINGNNNLDSFGKLNINQMEKVGSTDQVNVVVQWASLANGKTKRLFVVKDEDAQTVTSPVVQDMGSVDMGDWHSLVDFVRWGVQNYPAKHYFINVWDHGSGWHTTRLKSGDFNPMDISWDDNTGNSINTIELGQAMEESARIIGHKVDIYGSDACLMAMAEVASEMKDHVEYYIGSQDLEPGAGWPYDTILSAWNKLGSDAAAPEIAKIVASEYAKSYQGGQNGYDEITFSAYDLSKTDRLYGAIEQLNRQLNQVDAAGKKKVLSAFAKTQKFYYSDYRDLPDFVDQLEKVGMARVLRDGTFREIRAALKEYVIANEVTHDFRRATGLSIWMTDSKSTYNRYKSYYNKLRFQADTKWGDTLSYLLGE